MPTRTGTASQVDGSAGDGSTSVTVPADATAAVCFFGHWDDAAGATSTMASLTLGGNAFAVQSQKSVAWNGGDETGVGVAFLETLPGTGSQTFAWAYSAGGARGEGGKLVIVWIKDHNPGDAVRDADSTSATLGTNVALTLDTEVTDLLLAFASSFNLGGGSSNPALDGSVFINNAVLNGDSYDASEVTPSSPTTTVNMTGEDYSAMAAISLKVIPPTPEVTAKGNARRGLLAVS